MVQNNRLELFRVSLCSVVSAMDSGRCRLQIAVASILLLLIQNVRSVFLPRCMECRRGLAMRIPSVRLSVRPSVCQTRAL